MSARDWATADLCDERGDRVQAAQGVFHDYGGANAFTGRIATLRVAEDWRPVLRALEEPGRGRVLVVDGGGSLARAILGEKLLTVAARKSWSGVIVHGAVRDIAQTSRIPVGLRALGATPRRGESGKESVAGIPVAFAGVVFTPGAGLWADADGIVVEVRGER